MIGDNHTRLGLADTGFALRTCGPAVAVVAASLVTVARDQLARRAHSVAALISSRLVQLTVSGRTRLAPFSSQVPTETPSQRTDFDLRVCRSSVSTVENDPIRREPRRAIRRCPSLPSEPSGRGRILAGDQRQQPKRVGRSIFALGRIPAPPVPASAARASLTRSDTSACLRHRCVPIDARLARLGMSSSRPARSPDVAPGRPTAPPCASPPPVRSPCPGSPPRRRTPSNPHSVSDSRARFPSRNNHRCRIKRPDPSAWRSQSACANIRSMNRSNELCDSDQPARHLPADVVAQRLQRSADPTDRRVP